MWRVNDSGLDTRWEFTIELIPFNLFKGWNQFIQIQPLKKDATENYVYYKKQEKKTEFDILGNNLLSCLRMKQQPGEG